MRRFRRTVTAMRTIETGRREVAPAHAVRLAPWVMVSESAAIYDGNLLTDCTSRGFLVKHTLARSRAAA